MIPVGESTPFHDHRTLSLTVVLNDTEISNVIEGGSATDTRLNSGTLLFSDNSGNPYPSVHRIAVKGSNPHRVVEIDFRSAPKEPDGVTNLSSDESILELITRARDERPGFVAIPSAPNSPILLAPIEF